jgi:hypothetical protein
LSNIRVTGTHARLAGVIAATAGALLVVALFVDWWGPPPRLLDPPANLPSELEFVADGFERRTGFFPEIDAFAFYAVRDVIWLITGIAGFAYGLALLLGARIARPLGGFVAIAAVASVVLLVAAIISPPDYLQVQDDRGAPPLDIDFDLPFGREIGPWLALLGALGLVASAIAATRRRSTPP